MIYASRATIGALAIATNECCTNQGCKSLIPYEAVITSKWAYYALIYATPAIKNLATGTTFAEISGKKLGSVWIPLPPIKEQDRITAQVDEMLGRLDQMEAAYSEFAGPMTEHFRNLMLDKAIKGELVPQLDSEPEVEQVGPAPKPDEVLFELPPKWKWVQAEHLGSWKSGQTPRRSNKRFWEQGTIPWLKSGEITDGLIYDIGEKVTAQAVNECNIRLNPSGSVVVALYGATAGKVGILQDSCVTNQACCVCIVNSDLAINWYLFYALLAIREMLLNKTAGSAQPNLSKEKVIATWIPVPPLEEQRRIVAKLEEVFAGVEKLGSLMEYA